MTCATPSKLPGTSTVPSPRAVTLNSARGWLRLAIRPIQPHLVDLTRRRGAKVVNDELRASSRHPDLGRRAARLGMEDLRASGNQNTQLLATDGEHDRADHNAEDQAKIPNTKQWQPPDARPTSFAASLDVAVSVSVAISVGVAADLGHEAPAQVVWRRSRRSADRERIDNLLKRGQLVKADDAGFEVLLKARQFVALQRAQNVGRNIITAFPPARTAVTSAHDPVLQKPQGLVRSARQ